jgi:tetratricopeptide (TPR) repeat protein
MTRYLGCCLLCLLPSLAYGADDDFKRGVAALKEQDYDLAIACFSAMIRDNPKEAAAYNNRGIAYLGKEEYGRAIEDLTVAIRLDPRNAAAYNNRGVASRFKKDYGKAIRDYSEAIRLAPKYADAYTNLAWLYATCPDDKVRDGKKALQNARKACELTGWKNAGVLDKLAAACAESGQFKEAVKWQKKALEIGWDDKEEEKARKRLKLYEADKPYRDE